MGFLGVVIIQFQWCNPMLVCASGPTMDLPMVRVWGRLPSPLSSTRTSKLTSLKRSIGTSKTNASLYTGSRVFLATEVFVFFIWRPANIRDTLANGSRGIQRIGHFHLHPLKPFVTKMLSLCKRSLKGLNGNWDLSIVFFTGKMGYVSNLGWEMGFIPPFPPSGPPVTVLVQPNPLGYCALPGKMLTSLVLLDLFPRCVKMYLFQMAWQIA